MNNNYELRSNRRSQLQLWQKNMEEPIIIPFHRVQQAMTGLTGIIGRI